MRVTIETLEGEEITGNLAMPRQSTVLSHAAACARLDGDSAGLHQATLDFVSALLTVDGTEDVRDWLDEHVAAQDLFELANAIFVMRSPNESTSGKSRVTLG